MHRSETDEGHTLGEGGRPCGDIAPGPNSLQQNVQTGPRAYAVSSEPREASAREVSAAQQEGLECQSASLDKRRKQSSEARWVSRRPQPPVPNGPTAEAELCDGHLKRHWTGRIVIGARWDPAPCGTCGRTATAKCKQCYRALCIRCAKAGMSCTAGEAVSVTNSGLRHHHVHHHGGQEADRHRASHASHPNGDFKHSLAPGQGALQGDMANQHDVVALSSSTSSVSLSRQGLVCPVVVAAGAADMSHERGQSLQRISRPSETDTDRVGRSPSTSSSAAAACLSYQRAIP